MDLLSCSQTDTGVSEYIQRLVEHASKPPSYQRKSATPVLKIDRRPSPPPASVSTRAPVISLSRLVFHDTNEKYFPVSKRRNVPNHR